MEDTLASTVDAVQDGVSGARDRISQAQRSASGRVTEQVDASYLVPPQAPDDPVADLRWSAGQRHRHGLEAIADTLLEMAAEAATPVIDDSGRGTVE